MFGFKFFGKDKKAAQDEIVALSKAAPAQIIPPGTRHVPMPNPHIDIKDVPEDRPKFKKEYTGVLSNNAKIKVTAKSGYYRSSRYWSGELTQPNGRWVLFDPERVADKILDPQLVPLIDAFISAAMELDTAFVKSKPDTFTDEDRNIWKKIA